MSETGIVKRKGSGAVASGPSCVRASGSGARQGRVDLLLPGDDAAGQVQEVGVALLLELFDGLTAASAHLALDHHHAFAGDLALALDHGAQRDELALDVHVVVLVRLAYVDQREAAALVAPGLELLNRDLVGDAFAVFSLEAAELLVVHQALDVGVLAADFPLGVAAHFHGAEGEVERIVQEQAALEHGADAGEDLDRLGGLQGADHAG